MEITILAVLCSQPLSCSSHSLQKSLQELIMKELAIVMLIAGLIPALDCYPAVRWDPTASD